MAGKDPVEAFFPPKEEPKVEATSEKENKTNCCWLTHFLNKNPLDWLPLPYPSPLFVLMPLQLTNDRALNVILNASDSNLYRTTSGWRPTATSHITLQKENLKYLLIVAAEHIILTFLLLLSAIV